MIKPEDFLELVSTRQSDRGYLDKPVEKEKLMRCIEAARLAPSACNAQPWKFIIIDDVEKKNTLADLAASKLLSMNHFTKQAPIHVVIVQEKANFTSNAGQLIKNKDYPLIDIGIAAEHFCLQAKTEGLGTCILGWFNEKKVKELLHIPRSKRAELIITVGYPSSEEIRPKKRKEVDEMCVFNDYNGQAN
ncbi:MAG: nitroreductase family protein [Bacteroidales bacterium]|nr:nitroreductase family protein [Bacteroidales bacterium]